MTRSSTFKKQNVKANNRFAILDTIRKIGPMSRKEIAKEIKLTPAALTILTSELIEEGIIREVAEANENRAGRKSILIDIDNHRHVIICVYLDLTGIEIAATYLNGDLIELRKKSLQEIGYYKDVTEGIAKECRNFIEENSILKNNKDQIAYIGLSIVGIVDEQSGLSKSSFGVVPPGMDIKRDLEEKLNIPVAVENNVRALAVAEIDFNNDSNVENAMFIKHGPGVGAAIIINRNIYRGSARIAGEIGHVFAKDNEKLCPCGKKGCLETVLGESYIVEESKKVFSKEKTPYIYKLCVGQEELITFELLLFAGNDMDSLIKDIFDEASKCLAIAIDNAMQMIDLENVILFGLAFESDFFATMLNKNLDIININRNYTLENSKLNFDEQYKGCSAVGVRSFLRRLSNGKR